MPTSEVTNWETTSNTSTVNVDNGVAFSDNCTGYRVPQLEREALIAFYNATDGGTSWIGTFWDTDPNSLSNVGAWSGVTTALVNGQKHVVRLDFNYARLNGDIPSEIKDLTELTELNLGYYSGRSDLTAIAPEIGELSNLTRLDLTGNQLSVLPTEIGDLSSLVYLNISNNALTSLPSGIGNFAVLEELYVYGQLNTDDNTKTLTSLPDEIGSIGSLKRVELQNNGLINVPASIGNLTNLEFLNLENNALTSLPSSINNLTFLKEFTAAYNFIEGAIDLSNLTVLNRLTIEYNHISNLKLGVAPTAFSNSTSSFNIIRNACGCIEVPSDELVSWQLSDFKEENSYIDNGVVYSDNCASVTTNSIPTSEREALIAFYNNTLGDNWRNDLTIGFNGVPWVADEAQTPNVGAWFGVTTDVINGQKHVTKIELNSNLLSGVIPSEIKNLSQLIELEVSSNSISEIAPEIGELANLEQLTIAGQNDQVSNEPVLKSIPSEINNLTNLKRLDINSNAIEGNLDFSNLINVRALRVASNEITGLKIGVSSNVFDNTSDMEGKFIRSFDFYNQYINCISVPQSTISDWEATSFASTYPNIIWGQDCSAYNNVPENEIQALVDMYNDLDGGNWTYNENWNGNLAKALINNPYNATKWYGVTTKVVDGGKHITQINLSNNNLSGTVSSSISNLNKLETLNLSSNNLVGNLPLEMSLLSYLKTAYFQNNMLSGKVPDFSTITSLETLYISTNEFQFGDFEDEFTAYQNLTSFSYSPQADIGEEEAIEIDAAGIILEATVSGTNNEYQWYKNNSPITDAISATYEVTEASSNDDGFYYCIVSNTVITDLTIQTARKTLTYTIPQFELITTAENGTITVNIQPTDGTYDEGTEILLTAVPDEGYVFDTWSGDISTNGNPILLTMDSDKTIIALFKEDTAASTADEELQASIKVYPNPVEDKLYIQNTGFSEIMEIQIYTILGKSVGRYASFEESITISDLARGVYILNIKTKKGSLKQRIMKR